MYNKARHPGTMSLSEEQTYSIAFEMIHTSTRPIDLGVMLYILFVVFLTCNHKILRQGRGEISIIQIYFRVFRMVSVYFIDKLASDESITAERCLVLHNT